MGVGIKVLILVLIVEHHYSDVRGLDQQDYSCCKGEASSHMSAISFHAVWEERTDSNNGSIILLSS